MCDNKPQFLAGLGRVVDVAAVQRTHVAAGVTHGLVKLELQDVREEVPAPSQR